MTVENLSEYQVLARKYRPQQFDQLVGQETLVQVISNAIKYRRLPHAFLLTGVRGVGKTTTARIIARMLNCVGLDGQGLETVTPCGQCPQCQAITQDRHLDVIEMDAASRTGIDDIREVIDATHYKAVLGRYKVYIIDEVHMLSKNAFNALLKTLEEPPEHIKFIFATTEIKKVPDTVLSRCTRFELKRLNEDNLQTLFSHILDQENVKSEPAALQLLARAAQGSARDGLSLLDQALNINRHNIDETTVRSMLSIMDRSTLIQLFQQLLQGQGHDCLNFLQNYYHQGHDPGNLMNELLDICNHISLLKTHPAIVDDKMLSSHEKQLELELAAQVSMPVLSRFWQVLLKGYDEIARAPSRMQATQMIFLRLCYMAHLPTPQQALQYLTNTTVAADTTNTILDTLSNNQPIGVAAAPILNHHEVLSAQQLDDQEMHDGKTVKSVVPRVEPVAKISVPQSFDELVTLVSQRREPILLSGLHHDVHLIDYQPGHLKIQLGEHADKKFVSNLKKNLELWTEITWHIDVAASGGAASLQQQRRQSEYENLEKIKQEPMVMEALAQFPGATIGKIENNIGDFKHE